MLLRECLLKKAYFLPALSQKILHLVRSNLLHCLLNRLEVEKSPSVLKKTVTEGLNLGLGEQKRLNDSERPRIADLSNEGLGVKQENQVDQVIPLNDGSARMQVEDENYADQVIPLNIVPRRLQEDEKNPNFPPMPAYEHQPQVPLPVDQLQQIISPTIPWLNLDHSQEMQTNRYENALFGNVMQIARRNVSPSSPIPSPSTPNVTTPNVATQVFYRQGDDGEDTSNE